ncbi:FAD/NAD(P)-binding protein [Lacticaseibacillus parahuelsenbergensis]|uniref:FAD/NAD(P)-binding protein n=1 Tax=Lacticaseibacillus parahuelsenbergensis TaxID=3068305 RepID=A0ABY9L421_9LACO|nr:MULTISPECIES: FAD/NAD(P)-binding protein [Lacticaseibacillus]MDE3281302.1 FAD/NAD(P)-binding protein [Lacticaseibacillus casei]WLV78228.1 FAD/NAD(P)-binding protein [Lacticaseibacillus sp. NCIMB 15471]
MHITLIGAGPRGLLLLSRLLSWQPTRYPKRRINIVLVDPYPIGGRVWKINQDPDLIMNTAASQITLFTDQSVTDVGPFITGPDLSTWALTVAADYLDAHPELDNRAILLRQAASLGPNSYASRALYGVYQQWFFDLLRAHAGQNTITYKQQTVTRLDQKDPGFTITTDQESWQTDQVVMALGNLKNSLTRDQKALHDYAKTHKLFYLEPGFPEEGDLSNIEPQAPVIVRGLGLSFFDLMSRLTEGRGGQFQKTADGLLAYHPSGREPHIFAGSRRGFPYRAKGHNQKGPGEEWEPQFLTPEQINAWQARGEVSGQTFWEGLKHEAELIYYRLLLPQRYPDIDETAFERDFLADPVATLGALPIAAKDRLDWDVLADPTKAHPSGQPYQDFLRHYLRQDAHEAMRGTKTGPLTSALEVLRDMRDPIRQFVERGLFSQDQYLDFFLRWFNSLNDFLSIGPPALRIDQLQALIGAGIVTILPPGMQIKGIDGQFLLKTPSDPKFSLQAKALLEARVPAVNAPTAQDPLVQQLLHDGYAHPYELQLNADKRFQSGAIAVDRQTQQLLDANEQPQAGLFFWGVPTEGVHWLTTASPRPLVNDVSLKTAEQIVKTIFAGAGS